MNNHLKRKYGSWALVTGASSGIGRAIAVEFAKKGINVFLVARNHAVLSEMKVRLENQFPIRVKILSIDLSEKDANNYLFSETSSVDIGIFAASAGFGTSGQFLKNNIAEELNMIDLNCRSVVEQTHEFARRFKQRKSGSIILFSSLFAFQGVPGSSNYAATKAFIQSFGEGISVELKKFGVDVLIAAPGPVITGFGDRADMKFKFGANPESVGKSIIHSVGKATTVRPGFLAKLLEFGLWITFSRKLRTLILTQITKDMTRHQIS